jgi:hypothetical protein
LLPLAVAASVYHPKNGLLSSIKWYVKYLTFNRYALLVMGTGSEISAIYRMSQEECARLREGVLYVKIYRYNPKHLCPKLNGYGDNGQRSLKLDSSYTLIDYQIHIKTGRNMWFL